MMVMLVLFERMVECVGVECTARDGDLHHLVGQCAVWSRALGCQK